MAEAPMTVVETEEFLRKARPLMSAAEREELVAFMGANPEAGKIIPEIGGVRKVRWRLAGKGKRGGARHLLLPQRKAAALPAVRISEEGEP